MLLICCCSFRCELFVLGRVKGCVFANGPNIHWFSTKINLNIFGCCRTFVVFICSNQLSTGRFKVTFRSLSWRWLDFWKGHLTIPKRSPAELPGISLSFMSAKVRMISKQMVLGIFFVSSSSEKKSPLILSWRNRNFQQKNLRSFTRKILWDLMWRCWNNTWGWGTVLRLVSWLEGKTYARVQGGPPTSYKWNLYPRQVSRVITYKPMAINWSYKLICNW